MFENQTRLWVIHISNSARLAERARNEGFMCIGWTRLGDLSSYDKKPKMKRRVAGVEACDPPEPNHIGRDPRHFGKPEQP